MALRRAEIMNKIKITEKNFITVRDALLKDYHKHGKAYHLAWKKPMKFYREHTPSEAIEILKQEAAE